MDRDPRRETELRLHAFPEIDAVGVATRSCCDRVTLLKQN
jgi:hypothetical protein